MKSFVMKSKVQFMLDQDKPNTVLGLYTPGSDIPYAYVEFEVADDQQSVAINVDGVCRFCLTGLPPGSDIHIVGRFKPVRVEKH